MCILPPQVSKEELVSLAPGIEMDLEILESTSDTTLVDLDMIGERLNWRLQADNLLSHDMLASIKTQSILASGTARTLHSDVHR